MTSIMAALGLVHVRSTLRALLQLNRLPARRLCTAVAQEAGEDEADEGANTIKRLQVDPATSIRYLASDAYKESYGEEPVWRHYRRNFKGQIPPRTRKTCIRKGEISTGSPCPICRDEYLVLDFKNVALLQQFMSPQTGDILDTTKTGLCQRQHLKLLTEVTKAQNCGLLKMKVPFREYDYSLYHKK